MIEIEIVNPNGTVSYRRPQGHTDIREALHTTGYHIRFTLPPEAVDEERYFLAGLRIAGIADTADTDEYSFGANRITRRMFIWSSWYAPTQAEYRRANDWAFNIEPAPPREDR